MVGGSGVGNILPIGAQAGGKEIRLRLKPSADMVGRPRKREEISWNEVGDRRRVSVDSGGNPKDFIGGKRVRVLSQTRAGAAGRKRRKSAAVTGRAEKFKKVRGNDARFARIVRVLPGGPLESALTSPCPRPYRDGTLCGAATRDSVPG